MLISITKGVENMKYAAGTSHRLCGCRVLLQVKKYPTKPPQKNRIIAYSTFIRFTMFIFFNNASATIKDNCAPNQRHNCDRNDVCHVIVSSFFLRGRRLCAKLSCLASLGVLCVLSGILGITIS